MSSGNFQKAFLNNFTIFITLKGNKIPGGVCRVSVFEALSV